MNDLPVLRAGDSVPSWRWTRSTLLSAALAMLACGGSPTEGSNGSPSPGGSGGAPPAGSGGGQGEHDAAASGGGQVGSGGDATGGGDSANDASDLPPNEASADAGPALPDADTWDVGPVSPDKCTLPAGLPLRGVELPQVPLTEDFAFDRNGNMVAVEYKGTALRAIPYQGNPMTLDPTAVQGRSMGMGYLPTGDLVILDLGGKSLIKITPAGVKSTLLTGLNVPYNLSIDRQGFVYVGEYMNGEIKRINGANGQFTVISTGQQVAFRGFTFSPDYRTLYVNDRNTQTVQQMSLAPNGEAGPIELLATVQMPGFGPAEMATDECGNVFVLATGGLVWRITPAGVATEVFAGKGLFSALRFGSGRGGWKPTALYLTRTDAQGTGGGGVEVELGVRGMPDPYLH
jgi:SMP-30/Gluconolactonase/LRE-like region